MPDLNEKLDRFTQIILDEAAQERNALLKQVSEERNTRIRAARAEIKRENDQKIQQRSAALTAETGRAISRKLLEDKRKVSARREEIAAEVFAAVREKIHAFTQTEDYLSHLKKLYAEAFSALGNPFDGIILLRPEDMDYARELAGVLPGRHVSFQEGDFTLGGLIVDCQSKLLRADQSYDTALGDLEGHFAELFGLSLSDDWEVQNG